MNCFICAKRNTWFLRSLLFCISNESFKDTHRKKALSNKTPALTESRNMGFGSLVHDLNSLEEVLKLKQNFQKNIVVTSKTTFFMISPFRGHHSNCLNIGS